MVQQKFPMFGHIWGAVVMIGFGSVGRGTLPLIFRHFQFDKKRMVVIDPSDEDTITEILAIYGVRHIKQHVTEQNYQNLLTPLLKDGPGQGFCVNLSVTTSSLDLMKLCRELQVLYIDTVVEPWLGYWDREMDMASRTIYALRDTVCREKARSPGGTTAVFTCGANPGLVSWLVKQALVDLAKDLGLEYEEPRFYDQQGWAQLMRRAGVKGIHIAERDTQRAKHHKPLGAFWNTWSVEAMITEGVQPAEMSWGTHERWMPGNCRRHADGVVHLEQPGAGTMVRSWCPTPGPQIGFLIAHEESISIADFFTLRDNDPKSDDNTGNPVAFRPTCHYAYHPCNDAILSWREMLANGWNLPQVQHVLQEAELVDGSDELGVLLYGHDKNAYWFGSRLSIEETRRLAPYQNATGLQVTAGVIAGMAWALENPTEGIVGADEVDYKRCLEVAKPYLGIVEGHYTDWTPLQGSRGLFPEDVNASDPWQFQNVLVH
ncbi:homospermidine synthase [Thozetella sp. PMI_491]|nr:homospermidine synthase [Thozetella sp. PMI_491]